MSIRNYNKLYVHTDREEGSEKLILGYQNDAREITLTKDTETVFHVPYYTVPILLSDSSFIQDGATAGRFPAAADRIYKNNKNYGAITANGSTSDNADGTWFCSWLYKDETGKSQWMDRYYNPGALVTASLDTITCHLGETRVYKKHDPVFKDIPSKMVLDPGVQYRYFHVGENTLNNLITTFGGVSGEHLKLNLNNWGTDSVDTSVNPKKVTITTTGDAAELYTVYSETDRVSASSIRFDNTNNIGVEVEYDKSYTLANEFSLAFWAHSDNWSISQTTQLVGNYSSGGGIGVFIDTLSSYPFFVIPETGYGHLLYVNEGYNGFLDKSVQSTPTLTASPQFVALDTENNVIAWNADNSGSINKYDNAGKLLGNANLPLSANEFCHQLLCGLENSIIAISTKARYTYDTDLNLINITPSTCTSATVAAFSYNLTTNTAELISTDNVRDSKFIKNDHWCLSADGHLYVRYSSETTYNQIAAFYDGATNIAIDPYDRIWVLHGVNKCSIYDTNTQVLGDSFEIGLNAAHVQKRISFICEYNRTDDARNWRGVVYYVTEDGNTEIAPQIYILDMNGITIQSINTYELFNLDLLSTLKQQQQKFRFYSNGDFTGYEHKRVFNKISPCNNQPQLIFKAYLKDRSKISPTFKQFKCQIPISEWNLKSWQHITVTLRNRTFKIYINGKKVSEVSYTGQYDVSYELQPSMFIGSPVGSHLGFNQEIKYPSMLFNGIIQDVELYNYELDQIKLEIFQQAPIVAQNMVWSLPIPSVQYVEQIERMFKNKIPGAKATYFNLKLCGTQITDAQTRKLIEEEIRSIVAEIKPTYTNFLGVHWVD